MSALLNHMYEDIHKLIQFPDVTSHTDKPALHMLSSNLLSTTAAHPLHIMAAAPNPTVNPHNTTHRNTATEQLLDTLLGTALLQSQAGEIHDSLKSPSRLFYRSLRCLWPRYGHHRVLQSSQCLYPNPNVLPIPPSMN